MSTSLSCCPILAGHGPTLFAGLSERLELKLVGRQEFRSGAARFHASSPATSKDLPHFTDPWRDARPGRRLHVVLCEGSHWRKVTRWDTMTDPVGPVPADRRLIGVIGEGVDGPGHPLGVLVARVDDLVSLADRVEYSAGEGGEVLGERRRFPSEFREENPSSLQVTVAPA